MTTALKVMGGGAPGTNVFLDSGPNGITITNVGAPVYSTTQRKFQPTSMYFDGSSSLSATVPGGLGATSGASFTIEMWVYPTASGGYLFNSRTGSGSDGMEVAFSGYSTTSGAVILPVASPALPLNQWTHVAVVCSGTSFFLFYGGVQVSSGTRTVTFDGTSFNLLGSTSGGISGYFTGYADKIIITQGVALYTAGYTPDESDALAVATAALSTTLPSEIYAYGGGQAACTAPSPLFYSGPSASANAGLTAPSPTLSASGGSIASLTAPSPSLYGTARSSLGDNDFTYTAPRATLSAFGGAAAKLNAPSPTLSITATVVNLGAASLEAPSATLSAAGTVSGTAYANLTFGSNLGSYDLIGYGGAVASITLTGSPTVQATGITGSVGRASLTAPLFELTASGTAQNYGSALLTAPSGRLGATAQAWLMAPSATLTAIGSAVVVATFEAYAVNLNHTPKRGVEPVDEATRYTNFPFTHVVRYKNSYFGANATGLYLLEGTTDDGADISYALKTTTSDLDSPNQKTVASAYFSGRLGPEATVTLYAGEGAGVPYAYNTVRGGLAQNHREVFGKGIKQHRYYALGLSGSDVLELDNVELDVKQMNRRI